MIFFLSVPRNTLKFIKIRPELRCISQFSEMPHTEAKLLGSNLSENVLEVIAAPVSYSTSDENMFCKGT
jgi:hypothetical protein